MTSPSFLVHDDLQLTQTSGVSKQHSQLDTSFSATVSVTDSSDSTNNTLKTATNDLVDTMADKLDIDDNIDETAPDQESSRLVEYFAMVSCVPVPVEEHDKKKERKARSRPPDPTKDRMNRSTAAKFEVRKAHLPAKDQIDENEEEEEDNEHLVPLEPKITARYPLKDHKDQPLNLRLPQFCHPNGTDIIYPTSQYKMPRIHHFVLTDSAGGKLYGTCLTVYEEFTDSDDSKDSNTNTTKEKKKKIYYAPRVLCLLSTYPYLTAFRTYLTQLYRLATMTDCMTVPIERYVQNICSEVPAPPPGAFEVQLDILSTSIRFWAPPADQPIAYVSLPFQVLFECLDIDNVLFAWYSLACERKVLLVSNQTSLLTVCCEILCSLLFPMKWSHLYIPMLPRSLCPMLDAPMPYLCGISRANFPYAVQDISDETVVVDLDRNVITIGSNFPELPHLPFKRRHKLEAALQANAGNVFYEARNLVKQDVLDAKNTVARKTMLEKAESVWNDKVKVRDDAFNLACAPDAAALEFDDDALAGSDSGVLPKQSRWDSVQEAFLRFYVSCLQDYRKFIPTKATDSRSSWRGKEGRCELRYSSEEFVHAASSDFQPFLSELVLTQQFDDFISRRMYNAADAPDVKFFDQSIAAKKNRSKLKFKKVETHFLNSAMARRDLKNIKAVEPSCEGLPDLTEGKKAYSPYKMWPLQFDASLFGKARPVPSVISAEFDRRHSLQKMFRSQGTENTRLGGCNQSPEVTSFVLFFTTFTSLIGREQAALKKNEYRFEIESEEVYHPLLSQFAKKSMDSNQHLRRQRKKDFDDDMEVVRVIAKTQVDVAYNALSLMRARKLPPDPAIYKLFIEACGRCNLRSYAPRIMDMLTRDRLATNPDIYTALIAAFSNDDQPSALDTNQIQGESSTSDISNSQHGFFETKTNTPSEHSLSQSLSSASRASSYKMSPRSFMSFKNKKSKRFRLNSKSITKKQQAQSKAAIEHQTELGRNLLESMYPDITIDHENVCPKCAHVLDENTVVRGFTPCATNNYQTSCPTCQHKFVPKFAVSCKSPDFVGSQGQGSTLYCDYLSPWVLLQEIRRIITSSGGIESILDDKFRSGTDIHSTLWWNMIVTFERCDLPHCFLLQGRNQLLLPPPSALPESIEEISLSSV